MKGEQISLTICQNVLQSVIKGDFDNEGVAEALLGFEELKIKFNILTDSNTRHSIVKVVDIVVTGELSFQLILIL